MNRSRDTRQPTARPIAFVDLAAQQARIRGRLEQAIRRVLDHGQYIMGPEVAALEGQLADFCGAGHAITCASGTDALLIAMMAKGVTHGDAVLCPGFTYPATPEAIALLGATPIFVDVDADTFNLDPSTIDAGVELARHHRLRPAGVIAVDLFGMPADYAAINARAGAHGLWVLADAAQSFGATYQGKAVGRLGDITATSFFPAKPLGCYGDGGAIFTADGTLAEVMQSIRLHGRGGDKYDIVRVGVNGRLDTIQAAVLLEKLAIFREEIAARDAVAARYTEQLAGLVTTPGRPPGRTSVWAQYTVTIAGGRRNEVAERLSSAGVPAHVYYPRPLHHQPAYASCPVAGGRLPISEALAESVLSLPMHPYLQPIDQDRVVEALAGALSGS